MNINAFQAFGALAKTNRSRVQAGRWCGPRMIRGLFRQQSVLWQVFRVVTPGNAELFVFARPRQGGGMMARLAGRQQALDAGYALSIYDLCGWPDDGETLGAIRSRQGDQPQPHHLGARNHLKPHELPPETPEGPTTRARAQVDTARRIIESENCSADDRAVAVRMLNHALDNLTPKEHTHE